MTKENKKASLGKRLWHAITEPIPDDTDEDQSNEQIPLAYELKKSAAPRSTATSTAAKQPAGKGDIQAPAAAAQATSAQTIVAAGEGDIQAPSVATEAASAESQANSAAETSSQAKASNAPTTRAQAKAARQAASAAKATARSATSQDVITPATSAVSEVASTVTSQVSIAARPTSVAKTTQPVISVSATEHDTEEEPPELPLSREALYGDQQPNGGSAAPQKTHQTVDVDQLSRVARHGETAPDNLDTDETRDNPHLKKKDKGSSRPHQRPQRRNGKLTAIGVGLLVIAALGAMFMFKHAKTTEANAKAAAESAVTAIYTSSAQQDIRNSASKSELTRLQTAIDGMKQSDEKQQLQDEHDNAAKMVGVRDRYLALYNSANLIKASVTVADVTAAQTALKNSSLRTTKTFFATHYTQKYTAMSKIIKPVRKYDAEYQKLYTSKHALKSSVSTLELDVVIKKLKPYRQQSALAKTDYEKLTVERKALAKKEQSAATSAANAVSSSYSAPAESSSVESSSSSATTYSSATSSTTTGNDTGTSSAASSSTYGTTSESSSATYSGNTTTGTTTGNGTGVSGTTTSTTN